MFGLLFALAYGVVFVVVDEAGVLFGALLGLLHGLFASTALVNVLLPVVHPRMGTGFERPDRRRCSSRPASCSSTTVGRHLS